MRRHENRANVTEKLSNKFGLSGDIIDGAMMVSVIGNQNLWIENYKGIIEYSNEKIRIQGKKTTVAIDGKNLKIEYYTNADMKIHGNIQTIKFV